MALVVASGAGLSLAACSGDDTSPAKPAGADASSDRTVPPAPDNDGATPDKDAASADGATTDTGSDSGTTVTFTVPSAGGSAVVNGGKTKITFKFPASAAGKAITLTPSDPTALGWPADQFSDVVRLGPDGTRFTDPVTVTFDKPVGAAFELTEGATKSAAQGLAQNAAGEFELRHFSALVLAPPGKVCDSEGQTDNPLSGRCGTVLSDGGVVFDSGATSFRVLTCKGYSFCLLIQGTCCVDPSVDAGGCTTQNQKYGINYTPTSNGGTVAQCDPDAGDWDGGDAGCAPGSLGFSYQPNGGCQAYHSCSSAVYRMDCDGTNCTCAVQGSDAGAPFTQGSICDTAATMKIGYVQKCNFPK